MITSREEPVNWVERRAKCNLDLTFEALYEVVLRDVDEMNKLPEGKRNNRYFIVEQNGEGIKHRVKVYRDNEENTPYVVFEKSVNSIRVHIGVPGSGKSFLVTPEWDDNTASCKLRINHESMKVWQISQKALSPLFFDL